MFIMAYNDYEAVKLITAARPNLGFYSCTHSPSHPCAKSDMQYAKYAWNMQTIICKTTENVNCSRVSRVRARGG